MPLRQLDSCLKKVDVMKKLTVMNNDDWLHFFSLCVYAYSSCTAQSEAKIFLKKEAIHAPHFSLNLTSPFLSFFFFSGKFIACSGFTCDARIYEVQSTAPGIFQGVSG